MTGPGVGELKLLYESMLEVAPQGSSWTTGRGVFARFKVSDQDESEGGGVP